MRLMLRNTLFSWMAVRVVAIGLLLAVGAQAADREPTAFERGLRAFESADYAGAEAWLLQAIGQRPRDAAVFHYMGLTYAKRDEHVHAVGALRRAAALNPGNAGTRQALGNSYLELGLYANARSALIEANRLQPDDATTLFLLALSAEHMKRFDEASEAYTRAAALDPDYRQLATFRLAEIARARGDLRASTQAYQDAIAADPGSDLGREAQDAMRGLKQGRRWSVQLGTGLEYDDNVTTNEIDQTSSESDYAGVFDLAAAWRPYSEQDTDLDLSYDLSQIMYSELSEFDLQAHALGAALSHKFGAIDGDVSYRYSYLTLGGDKFLELHELHPGIGFEVLPHLFHSLSYGYQNKNFASDQRRDADQHAGIFDSFYVFDNGAFALVGLRLEAEDTRADEFDYSGYYGYINARAPAPGWPFSGATVGAGYRYYGRDYSSVTPSIGEERRDDQHRFQLSFRQPLSGLFVLAADYEFINATSNLASADYNESIVSLKLEMTF